jgi:hypothetical protein
MRLGIKPSERDEIATLVKLGSNVLINTGRCWLSWCENTRYSLLNKSTNQRGQYRLGFIFCCVLVSRFRFARKFSPQSFGSTFQRLAIQSWRGQGDQGKQILDRKYVPFSSCQTILKNRKKIEEFGSFFHLLYKRGNLQHNGLNKRWAVSITCC